MPPILPTLAQRRGDTNIGALHGEPPDPAVFVAAVPNWTVGETFLTSRGAEWRILAIQTDINDELVDAGINALWTVEPV